MRFVNALKCICQECCHSSVELSVPTILPPQVRVLSTPSTLFSFIVFVLYLSCEKNENKQKEARLAHYLKNVFVCLSDLSSMIHPCRALWRFLFHRSGRLTPPWGPSASPRSTCSRSVALTSSVAGAGTGSTPSLVSSNLKLSPEVMECAKTLFKPWTSDFGSGRSAPQLAPQRNIFIDHFLLHLRLLKCDSNPYLRTGPTHWQPGTVNKLNTECLYVLYLLFVQLNCAQLQQNRSYPL